MVGLLGVRVGLAAAFALADMSVVWIYAALIGDYIVKALMLLRRFHSREWQRVFFESGQGSIRPEPADKQGPSTPAPESPSRDQVS